MLQLSLDILQYTLQVSVRNNIHVLLYIYIHYIYIIYEATLELTNWNTIAVRPDSSSIACSYLITYTSIEFTR